MMIGICAWTLNVDDIVLDDIDINLLFVYSMILQLISVSNYPTKYRMSLSLIYGL